MIPTESEIYSRLTPNVVYHLLTHEKDYFVKAERYVQLYNQFNPDSYYEKAVLLVDMILTPLISIANFFITKSAPSIMSFLSVQKVVTIWYEYYEYKCLQTEIRSWKDIVHSMNGPFISTNDPLYSPYVYADGMMRLLLALSVSKKRTKGT